MPLAFLGALLLLLFLLPWRRQAAGRRPGGGTKAFFFFLHILYTFLDICWGKSWPFPLPPRLSLLPPLGPRGDVLVKGGAVSRRQFCDSADSCLGIKHSLPQIRVFLDPLCVIRLSGKISFQPLFFFTLLTLFISLRAKSLINNLDCRAGAESTRAIAA